jgi:hypothetical protein
VPPVTGQKLLTEEEKRKFKDLKTTVTDTATGGATGSPVERTSEEKTSPFANLLEGNKKYIVIAVALLAVYFLFIKKR